MQNQQQKKFNRSSTQQPHIDIIQSLKQAILMELVYTNQQLLKEMSRSSQQPQTKQILTTSKIFISNLNNKMEEKDLESQLSLLFEKFGKIERLVVKHNRIKKSCFAFLEYPTQKQAQRAIDEMDQQQFFGLKMKIFQYKQDRRNDKRQDGCFNCGKSGHFSKECTDGSERKYEQRRGKYEGRERNQRKSYQREQRRRYEDRDRQRQPRHRSRSNSYDRERNRPREKQRSRDRDRQGRDRDRQRRQRSKDYRRSRSRQYKYRRPSYEDQRDRDRQRERQRDRQRDRERQRQRQRQRDKDRDRDRNRDRDRDSYQRRRQYEERSRERQRQRERRYRDSRERRQRERRRDRSYS